MRVLVVDDSRLSASSLVRVLERIDVSVHPKVVSSAAEALESLDQQHFDVAFLDIEMPGINGLELARQLKLRHPLTNVVYVTGYPEYALDAWSTQASAFLVKPVDEQDVRRALDNLRIPVTNQDGSGLFVQCFGNFEVFYDGVPVAFERYHTKELLAYLVDRKGALVSMGELMAVLWEDRPDTPSLRSQLRTLISDLRRTLSDLGYGQAVVKRRGGIAIAIDVDECDYYAFLAGNPDALNQYHGEYMCQYSWAESTVAQLEAAGV